jgi:hypothetical protein
MSKAWSVGSAIAAQSKAHDRLVKAIENKAAVEIWMGDCRITTCASMGAARLWIGNSKKYRVVQQGA